MLIPFLIYDLPFKTLFGNRLLVSYISYGILLLYPLHYCHKAIFIFIYLLTYLLHGAESFLRS